MKNIKSFIVFVFLIQFILQSCDETVEPQLDDYSKLLPLKVGNYWVYNRFVKDDNNKNIISSLIEDSVVIEKSELIQNRTAYYFVRYQSDTVVNKMILSYDNGIVYRLYDSNTINIPRLDETWFPIADFKVNINEMWNVYKQILNDFIFKDIDTTYASIYHHTVNGEYIFQDSMLFEGKKTLTKIFRNKFDSKMDYRKPRKLSELTWDTLTVTHLMKYYDNYQFLEGIGLYKISRDTYYYTITTEPSSDVDDVITFKGFEQILKNYKIK